MTRQERRAAERKRLKDLRKQLTSAKGADAHRQAADEVLCSSGGALDAAPVLRDSLTTGIPPLDLVSEQPAPTSGVSATRLAANRANAQLSTGPTTPKGRAVSSQNSFQHGLYSKQLIIRGEDPAELDALKADLRAEHQPANTTEDILVNEMAEQYWRIKRARRIEANLFAGEDLVIAHLNAVQRLMSSAERGFHKALRTLQEAQRARPRDASQAKRTVAQRAAHSTPCPFCASSSTSGSVPQTSTAAASGGFVPSDDLRAKYAALDAEFETIERFLKAA